MMDRMLQYYDDDGWHDMAYTTGMDTPEVLGAWACQHNDRLCGLVNRGQRSRVSMRRIITRVVVTDRETGAKVCEWPVVERETL